VIVVLGRPGLDADGRLDRPAGRIALAAARAGARVELVGSVGDDSDGDAVALELGRAGIGHAALLRDPAGVTPGPQAEEDSSLPRLDAGDADLGLRYLADCHVLVAAEPLDSGALPVITDAASYHGASLIVLWSSEAGGPPPDVPESATLLEVPHHDDGAFSELVGRYAALLESGRAAPDAWQEALAETGWENASA
jgi:hypothetical protein